ncbi:MAG: FAD:protein FMN transferase [Acidobacteriota bacterium]
MWRFHAMGTDVQVSAPALATEDEQRLAADVARLFTRTEQRFSRFLADSELSALNRATAPLAVSPEMCEVLRAARAHVAATDGLFDPAVGGALVAAGYDRSFAPGQLDRDTARASVRRARFAEVEIDDATGTVRRPAHVLVDLGGFLKGRTVDRAARLAPELAMIDAGGDAVVRGAGSDGRGWLVDIESPFDVHATVATLRLRDRAVATSAANRRWWRAGGELAHHLIDPRTGAPARSDLAQVTVVAATCEQADVVAKVGFIVGADAAAGRIVAAGVAGVLVTVAGDVRVVGELEVARA